MSGLPSPLMSPRLMPVGLTKVFNRVGSAGYGELVAGTKTGTMAGVASGMTSGVLLFLTKLIPGVTELERSRDWGGVAVDRLPKSDQPTVTWPPFWSITS